MDPLQAFLQQMASQPQPRGGLPATQPQGMGAPGGINPAEFPGGAMSAALAGGSLNPYFRALIAAADIMQPSPTAANDTISPLMAGARPQHPASTGIMPPGQWIHLGSSPGDDGGQNNPMQAAAGVNATIPPFDVNATPMPARPTSTGAMPPASPASQPMPARPVTPTPAAPGPAAPLPPKRPKGIDPKNVDLGNTRFTTFQYHVPNSARKSPIYTALNFGGSS